MADSAEVIIVGAGVAGLALAMRLGGQGRAVLLLDKSAAPRDKVCGEGLMPLGMAALAAAGLDPRRLPGQDFRGLVYRSSRQETLLDFGQGVWGRGIRRTALISALEAAALAHPSVSLRREEVLGPLRDGGTNGGTNGGKDGGTIRGVRGRGGDFRAQVVVAADGAHAGLARAAGMKARQYGYRMGLRRHYRLADGADWDRVRIGLFAPYDVYLTPVGGGTVLATTMTDRAGYDAIAGGYGDFLRGTPFGGIFRGAEPDSAQLGWHHPLYAHGAYHGAGMLLVGDAGGSLDPCLGMGISMALESAGHAAVAVSGILDQPSRRTAHAARYDAAMRALFRHYRIFDYIFRIMVISKAREELLLWGMRHWPETADAILGAVAERRPWGEIPWRSLLFPLRLGGGIFAFGRKPP